MTWRFSPTAAFGLALAAALFPVAATASEPVTTANRVEADGTRTMAHEALLAAPMADVWAAISTPEGWKSWAVPAAWMLPDDPDVLETSYDPNDRPGSASTIRQRFVARIPGRLLAFRTIKAPEGFPHWDTYRQVVSVFELEPAGQKTRIRLTSSGYPDNEAGEALITFFSRGNAETLESLQNRFTNGPVDWHKRP
jgi:uncharacterized protein YndB with AHSA1/START domain